MGGLKFSRLLVEAAKTCNAAAGADHVRRIVRAGATFAGWALVPSCEELEY